METRHPADHAPREAALTDLHRAWEAFGRTDPMWAILTDPARKGGGWEVEEFFESGREDVTRLLADAADAGATLPRGRCLDFGCGIGRLTQALCEHMESCDGVDIAPSMIELARQYNRHGDRCRYHVNVAPNLGLFDDGVFDAVVSVIVLQHIRPPLNRDYIGELIRVLKPGGIALFQVPATHHPEKLDALRERLPDGAHRARIRVGAGSPLAASPAQDLTLSVSITNESSVRWSAGGSVRLGNHWASRRGGRYIHDDGRASVPDGLGPGETVSVRLIVTAPPWPGLFSLELDLVEEGVCWFGDRGSPTLRIPVVNGGGFARRLVHRLRRRARSVQAPQREEPTMEMHCIPVDEVVSLVERAGGRVVDRREWPGITGPAWDSWRYIVRRERTAS